MASESLKDKLQGGLNKFGKDLDNALPEDGKVKTIGRAVDKGIDVAKDTYKGMKELGGQLAQKGKKMLTGKDVSEGLK